MPACGVCAVTVTFTMLSGGGFDSASRAAFVALAGLCLLAAGAIDGPAALRAARSPLALTGCRGRAASGTELRLPPRPHARVVRGGRDLDRSAVARSRCRRVLRGLGA